MKKSLFDDMPQLKISMVGNSGAGKSSFLSGVYHSLIESPVTSPDMVLSLIGVENNGDVSAKGNLSMRDIMKSYNIRNIMNSEAANGTFKDIERFNFNFRAISVEKEMDMQIPTQLFDYKGGTISNSKATPMNPNNLQDVESTDKENAALDKSREEVLTKIADSDVILLILDSIMLVKYSNDISLCKEKSGANNINMIFNNLSAMVDKENLTVLTILTKTDSPTIPQEFKDNNFEKLCLLAKEALVGVYSQVNFLEKTKHWSFGMIPVTAVGEGNADVQMLPNGGYKSIIKEGAVAKQRNIDSAFVYSVYCALRKRAKEYSDEVAYLNEVVQAGKKIGFDRKAKQLAAKEASPILHRKYGFKVGCEQVIAAMEGEFINNLGCEIH